MTQNIGVIITKQRRVPCGRESELKTSALGHTETDLAVCHLYCAASGKGRKKTYSKHAYVCTRAHTHTHTPYTPIHTLEVNWGHTLTLTCVLGLFLILRLGFLIDKILACGGSEDKL